MKEKVKQFFIEEKEDVLYILSFKRSWFLLLIPFCAVLMQTASFVPQLVEQWYSRGFYNAVGGALSRLMSVFPFSVLEVLVVLLRVGILALIVFLIVKAVRDKDYDSTRLMATILCVVSFIYGTATLLGGLNTYRVPFQVTLGLVDTDFTRQELLTLTESLIEDANREKQLVEADEDGAMVLSRSFAETAQAAADIMAQAGEIYPTLAGDFGVPKPVFFSGAMLSMNMAGLYTNLTFEANINQDICDFMKPYTMCHELTHMRGYQREDDANLAAYLACMASDDPEFRYSASLEALLYAVRELEEDEWEKLAPSLSEGVRADILAYNRMVDSMGGPITDFFTFLNDIAIRSRGQSGGAATYGRMVMLLMDLQRKGLMQ